MKEITIKIKDERILEMINLLNEYYEKMDGVPKTNDNDDFYESCIIEGLLRFADVGAQTEETEKIVDRIYEILESWGW